MTHRACEVLIDAGVAKLVKSRKRVSFWRFECEFLVPSMTHSFTVCCRGPVGGADAGSWTPSCQATGGFSGTCHLFGLRFPTSSPLYYWASRVWPDTCALKEVSKTRTPTGIIMTSEDEVALLRDA